MAKKRERKLTIFSGPLGWGWVKLAELAEIVGQSPKEVWKNFFGLSKDVEYGLLTWSPDLKRLIQDGTDPEDFTSVYVPAGWAERVLFAHRLGGIRVVLVDHSHSIDPQKDYCPEGAITCLSVGDYCKSAVALTAGGKPIDYCVNPPRRIEVGCCYECLEAGEVLFGHHDCCFPLEHSLEALRDGRAYLSQTESGRWRIVYYRESELSRGADWVSSYRGEER